MFRVGVFFTKFISFCYIFGILRGLTVCQDRHNIVEIYSFTLESFCNLEVFLVVLIENVIAGTFRACGEVEIVCLSCLLWSPGRERVNWPVLVQNVFTVRVVSRSTSTLLPFQSLTRASARGSSGPRAQVPLVNQLD